MGSSQNDGSESHNIFVLFYRRFMITCNLVLMALTCVFLFFFTLFFLDVWTNHGHTTVIPEVRKMTFGEAIHSLEQADLEYEISDSIYDNTMPPGAVKEVWPHPGTRVKPGRTVYVTINCFSPQKVTVSMPLTGVSSRQAITYLESLNVKNVRIVHVPSNFPDLVESAKIKGRSIMPGMQIPVNANVVLEVGELKPGKRPKASTSTVDPEKRRAKKEEHTESAASSESQASPSAATESAPAAAPAPAPASTPASAPASNEGTKPTKSDGGN